MTFESDLFGWTDPRDSAAVKAKPQFEVPKLTATLAVPKTDTTQKRILVQCELFEEAGPGDQIIYRSFEAVHALNGDWIVKSPRGFDSTTVHLGTGRIAAISELARGIDAWYAGRDESRPNRTATAISV